MPLARWNSKSEADEVGKYYEREIKGKVVFLTGVSPKSVGSQAAREIAKHEPKVLILAGRTESKIQETFDAIKAETPNASLAPFLVDFSSQADVRRAAAEVTKQYPSIDVVILNHGVAQVPWSHTEDGSETHMATNHFGPFLFVNLIRPVLIAAKDPRVVVVTGLHAPCDIRWDDYNWNKKEEYIKIHGYAQSKTANLLFALALADKWKDVSVFSVSPGMIGTTELGRYLSQEERDAMNFYDKDGNLNPAFPWKTAAAGAASYLVAAFDPTIKGESGSFITNCQLANDLAAPHARSKESAERLWSISEKEVGQLFVY